MMRNVHFQFLWAVMVAVMIGGCATAARDASKDLTYNSTQESLVIGRLVLDFRSTPIGFIDRLQTQRLFVTNVSTGRRYKIACESGGRDARFVVTLPPGDYTTTSWTKYGYTFYPKMNFSVSTGDATYIGTMKWIRMEESLKMFLGAALGSIPGQLVIEDDIERELKELEGRNPGIGEHVVKSLMHK